MTNFYGQYIGFGSGGAAAAFAGRGGTSLGWLVGGGPNGAQHDRIESWSFTSDGDSTDVANCYHARMGMATTASATHCWHMGGYSGGDSNVIATFAFDTEVSICIPPLEVILFTNAFPLALILPEAVKFVAKLAVAANISVVIS